MTIYVQIEDGTIVCATILKPTNLDGWEIREVASLADVKVGEHIPTHAEVEAERQEAYKQRVYPLVCEIMIYKDKLDELAETPAPIGQENAFAAKVAELRANIAQVRTARDEAIEAINAEYPYTVES